MSGAPINPNIVPDIIMALVSEDQKEKDDEHQRLEGLIASYPNTESLEFRYLNNIVHILHGTAARVAAFRKEFREKVESHDAINEDAVILLGTIITAISTSGWGIPVMAAISGGVMAGIKLIFKLEKGKYKDKMRGELNNQINTIIIDATNRVIQIYNDTYGRPVEAAKIESMKKDVSSIAASFSTSVIPPATVFSFVTSGKP